MSVTAIIVTRGDVDLSQIFDSFILAGFEEGQVYVWDNSKMEDLAVYGRYAAIEHARTDLIYVQDDDVVMHPGSIEAIVDQWYESEAINQMEHAESPKDFVVCNMPANFRHAFYQEHALVGFGACFHRDAPERAFGRFNLAYDNEFFDARGRGDYDFYRRTCDIVFTALNPRVLVDVPYDDLPWASAENRMWKQETHREERQRMLDLVLKVRDA